MLTRLAITTLLLMLVARAQSVAADKDYLERGEPFTGEFELKYGRAVRGVLSRGWRKDVVVRILDLPPFQPEWVAGIARTADGYHAFYVTTPKQIWGTLGFGSGNPKKRGGNYHKLHPTLQERAIPAPLVARIVALWRRLLADGKNYAKDPSMYLDSDQFAFHLSFFPGEQLTAHTTGLGRKGDVLWRLSAAIMGYLNGMPEREFVRDITKAERKLGT
jgi:hypothetical protein